MLSPGDLVAHWGYVAILLLVTLGNVGLPVPEESILVLAGYLSWRGDLRLPLVLAVGILSCVLGDNIGFWLGRRYGRAAIERHARRLMITTAKLDAIRHFVERYGALGVFVARFLPGFRFMAGPLAGATGLRPPVFFVANLSGAALFVPYAVGLGLAAGYGVGGYVERFRGALGAVEFIALIAIAGATALLLAHRALRARSARRAGRR